MRPAKATLTESFSLCIYYGFDWVRGWPHWINWWMGRLLLQITFDDWTACNDRWKIAVTVGHHVGCRFCWKWTGWNSPDVWRANRFDLRCDILRKNRHFKLWFSTEIYFSRAWLRQEYWPCVTASPELIAVRKKCLKS